MPAPVILGIGGAHLDRRGRVTGDFVGGASNPGTMREEVGGGVFNALATATRHGVRAAILSLRGGDAAGDLVAGAIAAAGIEDHSAVFLDRTTPSYTAILDGAGELVAGLAEMELYETCFERQLRRRGFREVAATAAALMIDANMPEAAIARALAGAGDVPVHAIAVSPAKAVRLLPHLDRLACLYMNRREAAALTGADTPREAVRELSRRGLASGIITCGGEPLIGFDAAGPFRLVPPAPDRVADVTGAGDALAGATMAGMLAGKPLREAARAGVAAALLTLETEKAVAESGTASFETKLALVPSAEPVP